MAFQPFSLDAYFADMIDGGIKQKKSQEDWFQTKSDEATMDLAKKTDAMRKKLTKKAKGGFFGSDLGKVLRFGLNFIPGYGPLINLAIAAHTANQRQNQLERRAKDLEKMSTTSGKWAGTFLEDYYKKGMTSGKAATKGALKSLKKADLLTGLLDVGLAGIGAASSAGTEGGKKFGKKLVKDLFGDKTKYLDAVPQSDKPLNKLFSAI